MRRILRKLSAEVGRWARHIDAAVDVIAQVDLVTAKAKYSPRLQHVRPGREHRGQALAAVGAASASGTSVSQSSQRAESQELRTSVDDVDCD